MGSGVYGCALGHFGVAVVVRGGKASQEAIAVGLNQPCPLGWGRGTDYLPRISKRRSDRIGDALSMG